MKEETYKDLCEKWEYWEKRMIEYLGKRRDLISREQEIPEDVLDKKLQDLENEYHQSSDHIFSGDWLYWGPTVIVDDLGDLMNPEFKLPGRGGLSFSDLDLYPEIIDTYGQIVELGRYGKCKVVGLMYDGTDDYILVEEVETGKRRGIHSFLEK